MALAWALEWFNLGFKFQSQHFFPGNRVVCLIFLRFGLSNNKIISASWIGIDPSFEEPKVKLWGVLF